MTSGRPFLISIIMPTYNRADYILETIRSIQSQTYENWELIIVDDGSTDSTKELVASVADNRIRFFEFGRCGVNGKLKNFGLSKASGEMIAFMDSDDLWAIDKLEKQIAAMKAHSTVGFSLAGGYNFKNQLEPTEFFYKTNQGERVGNLFEALCKGEIAAFTQSLIFKRECLNQVEKFDESFPNTDFEFISKMALNFHGVILYDHLFFRRIHDASHAISSGVVFTEYHEGLIKDYKRSGALSPRIADQQLFKLRIFAGEQLQKRGYGLQAATTFFSAWRYKPFSIIPLKKIAKALLTGF